jgi:hypothetical protein
MDVERLKAVGSISDLPSTAELVGRLIAEYKSAVI